MKAFFRHCGESAERGRCWPDLWEVYMHKILLSAVVLAAGFSSAAIAEGKKIGVSWAQFQEERWKIDEAAMKGAIEAAGN